MRQLEYHLVIFCMLLLSANNLYSVTFSSDSNSTLRPFIYKGCVSDSLGHPIGGAAIHVIGSDIRIRANNMGYFQFSVSLSKARVVFSALGFQSLEQEVFTTLSAVDTLKITLKVSPIRLQRVEIETEISVEEIMRRVVRQLEFIKSTYTTATTTVYTKSLVQSIQTKQFALSRDNTPQENTSIIESLERVYQKNHHNLQFQHSIVNDLRFSPNTDPRIAAASLLPLQSLNFTDKNITIFSTHLISPLSQAGLKWYKYIIQAKNENSRGIIYHIIFRPKQDFMPGMMGELWIDEKQYALQKAVFTLGNNTAIPFIDSLRIEQEYREKSIAKAETNEILLVWMPEITHSWIQASINIQPWWSGTFRLEGLSVMQNVVFNKKIPPSVLHPQTSDSVLSLIWGMPSGKTVALVNAPSHSMFLTFPEVNTISFDKTINQVRPIPLKHFEDSLYNNTATWKKSSLEKAGSLLFTVGNVQKIDLHNPYTLRELFPLNSIFTIRPRANDTTWLLGLNITGLRTRATDVLLGIEAAVQWQQTLTLRAGAMGNFGNGYGSVSLQWDMLKWNRGSFSLTGRVFSDIASIQPRRWDDPMFPVALGYNIDFILFSPWYDFYQERGIGIAARYINGSFHALVEARQSKQELMQTITTIDGDSRSNLAINNGEYRTLRTALAWNFWQPLPEPIYSEGTTQCGVRINVTLGQKTQTAVNYTKAESTVYCVQPTFATGYAPMYFELLLSGGWSSVATPVQEQFFLQQRYQFTGHPADFFSVPTRSFGGGQYISLRAEHNFSDWCWRVLGLPTYKGRGVELIAHGGMARYDNAINTNSPSDKESVLTTQGWYTEAGFGVGRIPTFLIDVLTLRFDTAWGLGAQGFGKFGWSISAHLQL
jgi:hypothetical protein